MIRIVKTFIAATAIAHNRLVKAGANDGEVALATASTDAIIGVVDYPSGAAIGERVDVVLFGEAEVIAGGTITPGAFITADAAGAAIAAAPAAGVNARTPGLLLINAVSGDIARALIVPNRIQG
jgi:hypothetical protein